MTKIYTKKGDNGETSLLYGGKFSKSEPIFDVLGTLDELNANLGLIRTDKNPFLEKIITSVQSDLFVIGASLADYQEKGSLVINYSKKTITLEKYIDKISSKIPELRNFILPKGSINSVYLHLCRAVCRRLERQIVKLMNQNESVNKGLSKYINRLSDLLFVLARYVNLDEGNKDFIWKL
jgi:cob(I)alamin adenosyltransferase